MKKPGAPEYSRVVPHRTTDSALQCLTAQIGRDAVSSLWYGPRWHVECVYGFIYTPHPSNECKVRNQQARVSPIKLPYYRVTILLFIMKKSALLIHHCPNL